MPIFKQTKTKNPTEFRATIVSAEGVSIPVKGMVCVFYDDDLITFALGQQIFTLRKNQVQQAAIYGEREATVNNRSVLGRSVVGAAIAGTTGAIVGGISGAGGKHTVNQHFYLYLTFLSTENSNCRIDMEIFPPLKAVEAFISAVRPTVATTTQL